MYPVHVDPAQYAVPVMPVQANSGGACDVYPVPVDPAQYAMHSMPMQAPLFPAQYPMAIHGFHPGYGMPLHPAPAQYGVPMHMPMDFAQYGITAPMMAYPAQYGMPMQAHWPQAAMPAASAPRYDEETERELEQWVEAKRAKDFNVADSIRSRLRAKGVDPDTVRPPGREVQAVIQGPQAHARFDPGTEAQLDRWVAAKREKDFGTADAIRSELRARGIEPDTARPSERDGKVLQQAPGRMYDPATEALLDRWVSAKREKDFGTADAIRSELRTRGIEPDTARPAGREAEPPSSKCAPTSGAQQEVDRLLDRWVEAKRCKDVAIADAIRSDLRTRGIEPDAARPAGSEEPPAKRQRPSPERRIERSAEIDLADV